jgi:hypothetical protein
MLEAETRFRKVEGYRGLATLAVRIEQDLLRRHHECHSQADRGGDEPTHCITMTLGTVVTVIFHDGWDNLTRLAPAAVIGFAARGTCARVARDELPVGESGPTAVYRLADCPLFEPISAAVGHHPRPPPALAGSYQLS